jgi:hypothetical protein
MSAVVCSICGGLDFCVSQTSSDLTVATIHVCDGSTGNRDANGLCIPGGQCDIHIEVKGITLTPQPNQDNLHVEIRLLVYNTAKNGHAASNLKIGVEWLIGGTTNCNVVLDTERSGTPTMRATADVKFTFEFYARAPGFSSTTFRRIIVMSSCCGAPPTKVSISRRIRSRSSSNDRCPCSSIWCASRGSPKQSASAFIDSLMPSVNNTTARRTPAGAFATVKSIVRQMAS